jgi:hypothetical protein
MIRPPYLHFKALLIEKSSPQPSHLRGRPSGDRESRRRKESRHSWLDNSVLLTNVGRIVGHVPVSFPLVTVRSFKASHSRDSSLNVDSSSSAFRSLQVWMTAVRVRV